MGRQQQRPGPRATILERPAGFGKTEPRRAGRFVCGVQGKGRRVEDKAPELRVLDVLTRFPAVERVILFGSRARGDAGPRADIDLAVACPQAGEAEWLRIAEAVEEEAETLLLIDLVRLEEASADLRDRIRSEGRVLYEQQARSVGRQSRSGP
ncbi:MAG: hypothetical protein GVY13_07285 [Alphaproteobacteria bacterium]|nr:hypothetical protein [Alphaproteobacteria bacterium]